MRGRKRPATLTALGLSDLMFDADYNPAIRAGIPVGVRAALDNHDPAPLLRLAASRRGPVLAPGPADVLGRALRGGVRGDAAAVAARRRRSASARRGRRPRPTGSGPGAFFPFGYAEARADEIDLCLRWPEASAAPAVGGAYPAVPALILQGGEDLRTPPESSARVAAALPGAQRVVLAGRGPRGHRRRPVALRRAAAVRVPARAQRGRRPASACRRSCRPPACRRGRWVSWRRRAGVPGVRGRTVAALDVTLDDLTFALSPALGSPLAGPGLRGGTFRLRRGAIELDGLRVVPGVRVSGRLPRRGSASLRISGPSAAARAGADLVRAARCAGGWADGRCGRG